MLEVCDLVRRPFPVDFEVFPGATVQQPQLGPLSISYRLLDWVRYLCLSVEKTNAVHMEVCAQTSLVSRTANRHVVFSFPLSCPRRILIVGGFQSSSIRLNDVWMYSVVSRQWEEKTPPVEQKSTLFSPRGGHSACCIGSQLWVYGGYGGALYSRKDLEDVHVLDLELWKWIKVRSQPQCHGVNFLSC